MDIKLGSYRWVQSIVSVVRINEGFQIETLMRTTTDKNPESGLDDLLYRHASQIHARGGEIVSTSVTAMNSLGEMKTIRAMGNVKL